MTSITSNIAALAALREVNKLNNALADSANRIATGRRIASAQDGAALWSLATRIEADNSVADAVRDTLTITKGILDAANVGITAAKTSLTDMRNLLVSAKQTGANRTLLQQQIAAIQLAVTATSSDATVNGTGVLREPVPASGPYNPIKSFVADVAHTAAGLSLTKITLDVRQVALINDNTNDGILDKSRTVSGTTSSVLTMSVAGLTDSVADQARIDSFIAMVDAALTETVSATSVIGVTTRRVTDQVSFITQLSSIKTEAVSSLVDANLEEEAATKDALVVRQQLAIEALSIANASLASILTLFK